MKSKVFFCLCILLSIFSLLAAAPVLSQEQSPDYFFEVLKIPNISGDWSGAWIGDTYGGSGALFITVSQRGSKISGKLDVRDTDCGDLYDVPFTGTISRNVVNFKIKTSCEGHRVEMKFTKGKLSSNNRRMDGPYNTYVDGGLYDRGTFYLNKE